MKAPGPFSATGRHSENTLLGDLCQMLRLKAQGALVSTLGVPALFDVGRLSVPQVLGATPRLCARCHRHLHARFLHPPLSKGPSVSTNNFYSGRSADLLLHLLLSLHGNTDVFILPEMRGIGSKTQDMKREGYLSSFVL